MARRKKKQSRKYIPKDEFRMNNSPIANGHPAYIFGETRDGKKYKSFGLTTEEKDKERKIKLPDNPESNNKKNSYIRVKPVTAKKNYYSKDTLKWNFSKKDRDIVRHLIKDYKKRAYRRKKKKK